MGTYQGAYKVSRGLLEEFGPNRVVDTPITELGFTGLGVGAAMVGLPGHRDDDLQLRVAGHGSDHQFSGQDALYVRRPGRRTDGGHGPGGAALQLGSQHSQALEAHYAHIPGLKVVMPATPADAKGLLKSAIRDDNPVIFIEGEMLYNTKGEVPDGEHIVPLGVALIKQEGTDVTLISHSKSVAVAMKAAEQLQAENISAEVIDLRTIRPLDVETVLRSVAKTHRCVVIEEGWPFAGVGAQVVHTIQEEIFDELDAPVLRVTGADVPMPYNKVLERAAKADPAKVIAAVKKVMYLE